MQQLALSFTALADESDKCKSGLVGISRHELLHHSTRVRKQGGCGGRAVVDGKALSAVKFVEVVVLHARKFTVTRINKLQKLLQLT